MLRVLCLAIGLAGPALAAEPAGDPVHGEQLYGRCFACHAIDRDRTGPRHRGLFGRRAGSVAGFPYSPAMRKAGAAGLIWNEETLDRFLKSPTKMVPGTRMTYAGIADDKERRDLIAYLRQAAQP